MLERCSTCGGFFDLTYDLEADSEELAERIPLNAWVFKQLCWVCRA